MSEISRHCCRLILAIIETKEGIVDQREDSDVDVWRWKEAERRVKIPTSVLCSRGATRNKREELFER
jgi:hypothetical protein